MSKNYISKTAGALIAGVFAFAGAQSLHAQTVIYSDTFGGTAGSFDGQAAVGVSGVDGGSGGALGQSDGVELTEDGAGDLTFPASSSNHSDYMRFDTIGNPSTYYNWASGAGASDITAAGGMAVSFNWVPNDTTSGSWLFFVVGTDSNDDAGSGGPIFNPNTSGGIFFKNSGTAQAYDANSAKSNASFTPTLDNAVTLDYSFTSFAAGSPVSLTAYVNGTPILTDSFTWLTADSGVNYMDLGSYQESNTINNFQITTLAAAVPEPRTYGLLSLGVAGMLLWGRMRAARRLTA